MTQEYQKKDRKPFLTLTFIFLNVIAFILVFFYLNTKDIFGLFAFSKNYFLNGNYYTIISASFLHENYAHLFWNMLFLFLFGRVVEKELGRLYFVLIYFSSMILGNVFFALLFPEAAAVGASGAVFGLMGAAMLIEPFRPIFKYVPIPLALVGAVYLGGELSNFFNLKDQIAHAAHVGGILAGSVIAFFKEKERSKRGIWAVLLFLLLALAFGIL